MTSLLLWTPLYTPLVLLLWRPLASTRVTPHVGGTWRGASGVSLGSGVATQSNVSPRSCLRPGRGRPAGVSSLARSFEGTVEEIPSLAGPTEGRLAAESDGDKGLPRRPHACGLALLFRSVICFS